jgi:phospholipase C
MRPLQLVIRLGALAASCALAACGGGSRVEPITPSLPGSGTQNGSSSSPIKHVVIVVQENRTFNDLFATFPGADGSTTGKMRKGSGSSAKTVTVKLSEKDLFSKSDVPHTYPEFLTAYRDGNMDGFNKIRFAGNGESVGSLPYQYVNPAQIKPYWALARQYVLADHLFQTQGSGSFTAHQDLIAGGTAISSTKSVIDYPTGYPWGCSAPSGTVTSLITTKLQYLANAGPFPCFKYSTLQTLLDAKHVSWKYYVPVPLGTFSPGSLWNAFLAISAVYDDRAEWNAHIAASPTRIFTDISGGALPAVSWLIPDAENSDHPGYGSDTGPSWVAQVVNAIGESKYWKSTAIVILWDDWGGFYDPVKPPKRDQQGGPGFRVPMIVVSPYSRAGEVSHTVYEFGSIVRFVEDTFNLGQLGTTDASSTSIVNVFNFDQTRIPFKPIAAKYSKAYFLRQPPSNLPVDTE